jgi:hypothetical protein
MQTSCLYNHTEGEVIVAKDATKIKSGQTAFGMNKQ